MMQQEEMERLIFFETTRQEAKAKTQENDKDIQAWLQLGGALLELAHFRRGTEAHEFLKDSIVAFEKVLQLDANKHEAMWCLGNALTSEGFLDIDRPSALRKFEEAKQYFIRAATAAPHNEHYQKSLSMAPKAPEIYDQVHSPEAQGIIPGMGAPPGGGAEMDMGANDDFFWTCVGWGVLAASLVTFALYAPKPPPMA